MEKVYYVEVDFHVFEAKFGDSKESKFELLANLLFCAEFEVKTKIYRYHNQKAIKTKPLKFDDGYILYRQIYNVF